MNTPTRPHTPSRPQHTQQQQPGISVQVALRIRPSPVQEDDGGIPVRFQRVVVQPVNQSALTVDNAPPNGSSALRAGSKQTFTYDRVFGPTSRQTEVYKEVVDDLVKRFVEGYNVTCLAYGQTSAGKSYTMGTDYTPSGDGDDEERTGIIPRAIQAIFHQLSANPGSFNLKNSYIELYNEDLIDLLATNINDRPQVTIREDKAGHILWTGLREVKVESVEDVMQNLATGSSVRQTSATDMNAQSSRSHAIFSLTLTQSKSGNSLQTPGKSRLSALPRPTSPSAKRPPSSMSMYSAMSGRDSPALGIEENVTITSKFHFVDLAGSERLKRTSAVGERVKEGISINSGLHALGNVISALGDPNKARSLTHIPYRDSKLTRLLQDSLGGNARTLMIACVDAREYNLNETLNTLKYANRARNIKNTATINEVEEGWDNVEHLQQMIVKLRADLLSARGDGDGLFLEGARVAPAMLDLQDRYAELSLKHAKLTADLAKTGALNSTEDLNRQHRASLSPQNFAVAVEPVVEEYEKSLSALESQLSLTRAALAHTEEALREQESANVDSTHAEQVAELQARIAKNAEREETTEAYLRDLETRLKNQDNDGNEQANTVAALRLELAKIKENEETGERYIKDLERRLAASEGSSKGSRLLSGRSDRDSKAGVENSSALAGNDIDLSALMKELAARDHQIATLQQALSETKAAFDTETSPENNLSEKSDDTVEGLRQQIDMLQSQLSTGLPSASPELSRSLNASNAEDTDLRERYERSLAQIHSLSHQLASIKAASYSQASKSPVNVDAFPISQADPHHADMEVLAVPPRTSSRSGTVPLSPTRSRRSLQPGSDAAPNSSQGNEWRQSLNGRPGANPYPPDRLSLLGLRRSASLSQDWQSALVSPTFTRKTSIARSVSPTPSRDSFSANHGPTYDSVENERGIESFLKEIAQLQDVISKREDEIRELEQRVRLGGHSEPLQEIKNTEDSSETTDLLESMRARSSSNLSSDTREAEMDDLLRSMARKETAHSENMSSLNLQLEALRKEYDALQLVSKDQVTNMSQEIEQLQEQLHLLAEGNLAATEKLALLEEQFAIKQDEIEAARMEAAQQSEEAQAAMRKAHESEILALTQEHSDGLAKMQAEHGEFLGQMMAQREELFVSRSRDFDASIDEQRRQFAAKMQEMEAAHQSTLADRSDLAQKDLDALRDQHDALKKQLEQLQESQATHSTELSSQHAQNEAEISRLRKELEEHQTLREGFQEAAARHQIVVSDLQVEINSLKEMLEVQQKSGASLETPMLDGEDRKSEVFVDAFDVTPAPNALMNGILGGAALSKVKSTEIEDTTQKQKIAELENDMADMANLLGQMEKELEAANDQKDALLTKHTQTESLLRELEKRLETAESTDLARSSSSSSSRNGHSSMPPNVLSSRAMSTRFSQSSTLAKSPPKAPPPSASLPPLPTALPAVPSPSDATHSLTSSPSLPKSARDSAMSTSTLDGTSMDPRIQKRIDEQDIQMGKLSKQLSHAEADLKANIDLVNTLEGALNDTEKSLRKARMQINDYAKDRDAQAKAKDLLRGQLVQANEEMKQLREKLAAVQQADSRQAQERNQKDQARAQLEQRLADLQTRKSKFACF